MYFCNHKIICFVFISEVLINSDFLFIYISAGSGERSLIHFDLQTVICSDFTSAFTVNTITFINSIGFDDSVMPAP